MITTEDLVKGVKDQFNHPDISMHSLWGNIADLGLNVKFVSTLKMFVDFQFQE